MSKAKILERIIKFSRELDVSTLDEFMVVMRNRLTEKRNEGRTGWELMQPQELAELISNVL
ncbi:hypothetical protein ACRXCV_00550, partial (plasmid) [Halobacteriovorax sp. GFR7]